MPSTKPGAAPQHQLIPGTRDVEPELVVDRIIDRANERVGCRQQAQRAGVEGGPRELTGDRGPIQLQNQISSTSQPRCT